MRALFLLAIPACTESAPGLPPGSTPADPSTEPSTVPATSPPATTPVATVPDGCNVPAALGGTDLLTAWGPIHGRLDGGVVNFRGVPYAAPPTGSLRFAPPEPPACWTETRDATDYGPICPQPIPLGAIATQSEDCLSLNVWTPALDRNERPVLVFIHGGANAVGSDQDLLGMYDGSALASSQGVVVVTMQYRLGMLGFLAHPGLRGEGLPSGNQAIEDQQQALRWVRDHAEALGGDPDRVMLFGESAGAWNTCMHLAAPGSRGLFSSALMESGSCDAADAADAEADGLEAGALVGCPADDPAASLACLREKSASVLSVLADAPQFDDTWRYLRWGPVIDGTVLPDDPIALFRRGEHAGVPVLIGSNAQEGELFTPPLLTCIDTGAFEDLSFGGLAPVIHQLYPCLEELIPRWSAVDAVTDSSFSCGARRALTALHDGGAPVWRYVNDYTHADPLIIALRAFHGSELSLVFGTMGHIGYVPPPGEDELSTEMMATWTSMARDGDPGTVPWDPATDEAVHFDADLFHAKIDTVSRFRADECDQLDPLLFPN